jgi:hypothetical protein
MGEEVKGLVEEQQIPEVAVCTAVVRGCYDSWSGYCPPGRRCASSFY